MQIGNISGAMITGFQAIPSLRSSEMVEIVIRWTCARVVGIAPTGGSSIENVFAGAAIAAAFLCEINGAAPTPTPAARNAAAMTSAPTICI